MKQSILWTFLALAAFLAADSLLFRTGWYGAHLEPNSSAGTLENQLDWLRQTPAAQVPEVLVVGDSRIGVGFNAPIADAAASNQLHFWNFGIAGSTPRVWYYSLRDADPDRRRFAAIVIAIDRYSDSDWFGLSEDRILDQNFLVMRLGFGDCIDFVSSIDSMDLRRRALFSCLFRGILLRNDAQAFAANPKARIKRAEEQRTRGLQSLSNWEGKPETLRGLAIDWRSRTVQFPAGVTDAVRAEIADLVRPRDVPESGALTPYRQRWLGGIIDRYRNSPTRLIFLQLPRGPLIDPNDRRETPGAARFVASAARSPRVSVLRADLFADLERPELFADALHLNRDGRPIFTARLAQQVDAIVKGGRR